MKASRATNTRGSLDRIPEDMQPVGGRVDLRLAHEVVYEHLDAFDFYIGDRAQLTSRKDPYSDRTFLDPVR